MRKSGLFFRKSGLESFRIELFLPLATWLWVLMKSQRWDHIEGVGLLNIKFYNLKTFSLVRQFHYFQMWRRSTQLKASGIESQQAQFFFQAFFLQLYKVTFIFCIHFFILPFQYMKFIYSSYTTKNNTYLHLVCGCQYQSTGHQETHSSPALFDEWFHYQVSKSQRHT